MTKVNFDRKMLQTNLLKQSLLCAKKKIKQNKKKKNPYTIIKGSTTGSINYLPEANWSR